MVMDRTEILRMCVCVEPAFYRLTYRHPNVFEKHAQIFDHKCNKGFHVHFYTAKNLDCVESYLEPKDYVADFVR